MNILENMHNTLIFAPNRQIFSSPDLEGIDHEEVNIKTSDGENLHGYFLSAKNKTDKVFIFLHGNGDNVSAWYESCTEIQKHININALVVDYRGYGKSTGTPTREGVIIDAVAMYDFLTQRGFKAENISVIGRSLGGAIGLELAVRKKVKSIVVQSSFTSIKDIAKDIYPILPAMIIKDDLLNSKKNISQINIPILISHGLNDELIPVRHAYELFEAANKPKKLIIQKEGMHNDVSERYDNEYFEELRNILT